MVNFGGILAGAAEGGFRAQEELADKTILDRSEKRKADALEKRKLNLLRLQQDFQKSEREAGQVFKTKEREAGQKFESEQEAGRRDFERKQESDRRDYEKGIRKEETVAEEKRYQRRKDEDEAIYQRRKGEDEITYQRRIAAEKERQDRRTADLESREQKRYDRFIKEKENLPSNFKKTYADIKAISGQKAADAYAEKFVQTFGGKLTKGSKESFKMQELWTNTFNDALERGEELEQAKETADAVLQRFGFLKTDVKEDVEKSPLQQILDDIKANTNQVDTQATTPDGLLASHTPTSPDIKTSGVSPVITIFDDGTQVVVDQEGQYRKLLPDGTTTYLNKKQLRQTKRRVANRYNLEPGALDYIPKGFFR